MRALLTLWLATAGSPFLGAAPQPGPRVGLALSGGGARGIAHIGVLQALEDNAISVDYVVGTSMGAVIGGLYASGYRPEEILRLVHTVDWRTIFSGTPDRALVPLARRLEETTALARFNFDFSGLRLPRAAFSDYRIQRFLTRYLAGPSYRADGDFDRLPIPFRAVAADLRTGERVELAGGDLSRAVRASMSIPIAFPPVRRGDALLVDGGIADNLPVGLARKMGADRVIAVDISSPPLEASEYGDLLGIANQLTDVLMRFGNQAYREDADVTVRPDLRRHPFSDYSRFDELVRWGYEAAAEQMATVRSWGVRRRPRSAPDGPELEGAAIGEVAIAGARLARPELIRSDLRLDPGRPFSIEEALAAMDRVYASGLFTSCWIELTETEDARVRVVLQVEETEPRAVELGASYNDEDKARGFVRLHDHNLFGWGEQALLSLEASDRTNGLSLGLLGHRTRRLPLGYGIRLQLKEDKPRFFSEGRFINRAEFDRSEISAAAHLPLGRSGLLQWGAARRKNAIAERVGLDFPEREDAQSVLFAEFLADDLDDLDTPRRGRAVSVRLERNASASATLRPYWRGAAGARVAVPLGDRHVIAGRVFLGWADTELPLYEKFRIGGPHLLPGRHREELWGDRALGLAASHRFFLTPNLSFLGRAGAGAAWPEADPLALRSIELGAGFGVQYDTPVGPIQLELGVSEDGASRVYWSIGYQ